MHTGEKYSGKSKETNEEKERRADNLYETELMMRLCRENGFEVTTGTCVIALTRYIMEKKQLHDRII